MALINVQDYEKVAAEKMAQIYFDYYASGAHDEITLRENTAAYSRIQLRYRVLRGIETADLTTTIPNGRAAASLPLPLLIAPTGFQKLAHPEGERAMVRAAGATGVIMILSTAATTAMEDVVAAASAPIWFQLYMYNDRDVTAGLVQRAAAAGCEAIVLTVDTPVLGRRERDMRNQFQLPPDLELQNFSGQLQGALPSVLSGSGLHAYTQQMFKANLSWEDVAWLQSITDLPIWLKGVAHPADARLAVAHGVAGMIVSNHGGRQLDTAPATIDVLPDIVAAVGGQLPILIDGGIRRGSDIFKALALGATAVCIGRPALWGLAVNGQAGVSHVLSLLADELSNTMALCGVNHIGDISADFIFNKR